MWKPKAKLNEEQQVKYKYHQISLKWNLLNIISDVIGL